MKTGVSNDLTHSESLHFALQRARGIPILTDLAPYDARLRAIKRVHLRAASNDELSRTARSLRARAEAGAPLDALLPEAYALAAELAARELNTRPFDVQLVAAIVLHEGRLAQMRTGEGKTLAAVLPVSLNALTGRGVHVMTANEYLARRDAEWMGPIYRRLGLSVSHVGERMGDAERRAAYRADVTYLTAKQAGFDYLSDQLRYRHDAFVQRAPYLAIVDEADFILIDEARIPLVIASEDERSAVDARAVGAIIDRLDARRDFTIDREGRNCFLTLEGQARVAELLGCGGMHEESSRELYAAVHVALLARRLLRRDVDYIVRDGRIEVVDEFTGRVAEKRRWPYGVQTALEVKEGIAVRPEGRIRGSMTIQDYIALYPRLAALTATAASAAEELSRSYRLSTVVIPPNRPDRTVHAPDRVFATRAAKLEALVEEIHAEHARRRPVLVGTRTIRESEELARRLRKSGVGCRVLNAKNDRREASVVARAGMLGAVTIATNMAGRGTDIRLGGPDGVERDQVERLGGLYVIGTNRHESVRVDHQLRGRAGRQGDPGLTRFFISLQDEIMERYGVREFLPARVRSARGGGEIADRRVNREIERAQAIIEHQHSEMRRTLRNYTAIVESERRLVHAMRRDALCDRRFPSALLDACSKRREELARDVGRDRADELLALLFARTLDAFWAEQLAYVEDLREGIHLQRYGHREPLLVFIEEADDFFRAGVERALGESAELFERVQGSEADVELERLRGPTSTWTYLINDNPFPPFSLAMLAGAGIAAGAAAAMQLAVLAPVLLAAWGARAVASLAGRGRREPPGPRAATDAQEGAAPAPNKRSVSSIPRSYGVGRNPKRRSNFDESNR